MVVIAEWPWFAWAHAPFPRSTRTPRARPRGVGRFCGTGTTVAGVGPRASGPARTASSPTGRRSSTTSGASTPPPIACGCEEVGPHDGGPPLPGRGDHVGGEHGAPGGDPAREPAPGRSARPRARRRRSASSPAARRSWPSTTASIPTRSRPRRRRWRRPTRWPPATRAEIREILENTVVVMIPSHNPDGTQRVTEWYRRTPGQALGGPRPAVPVPEVHRPRQQPRLVHVHAAREPAHPARASTIPGGRRSCTTSTRWARARRGSSRRPTSIPGSPTSIPRSSPPSMRLGTHVAARLTSEGHKGVAVTQRSTTPGARRAPTRTRHGGVRLLTESAEARMATPIEVRVREPGAGDRLRPARALLELPGPVAGREPGACATSWTTSARPRARSSSTPRATATYWLRTFLRREPARHAAHASRTRSWCRPRRRTRWPRPSCSRCCASAAWRCTGHARPSPPSGRTFAAGSWVVLDGASPTARSRRRVLERQHYPDIRQYPGGPAQRPYDATAHTLPLLLGRGRDGRAGRRSPPTSSPSTEAAGRRRARSRAAGPGWPWAIARGELVALGRLLRARVPVRWATADFTDAGRRFPAGTLLVPALRAGARS